MRGFRGLRRALSISIICAVVLVLAVIAAQQFSAPSHLTVEDVRDVTAAIHKISPGFDVQDITRDSDGSVRIFVWTPGQEGGQTIAITKTDGRWTAAVEVDFF